MTTAHTLRSPVPWKLVCTSSGNHWRGSIQAKNGTVVATLPSSYTARTTSEERAANGLLLAAAPMLLEIAEALIYLDGVGPADSEPENYNRLVEVARTMVDFVAGGA